MKFSKSIYYIVLTLLISSSVSAETVVTITTPVGSFDILMLEDEAPLTVQNFLGYVNRGDYNGTFLHRSIPAFVVQGGGYRYIESDGSAPHIVTQPPVVNEFGVSNTRGTVAMAKLGGDPNSATSEWFVNLANNSGNLDGQNGGFTVFGRVVGDGMTVVDQIAALQRFNFGGAFNELPTINYSGGAISADIFVTITAAIASDFDGDGLSDANDPDDDNDGVDDDVDVFPFDAEETIDTDGDGTGNTADTDDDNDGVNDEADAFSTDALEWADTDNDGTGDNADEDQQTQATAFLMTRSTSANRTALHIINTSPVPQRFTGTLYQANGNPLGIEGGELNVGSIAPHGRLILTSANLETILSTSTWSGPAMLEITGTDTFELMSKLTSPSGLVSNTNCVRQNQVHNIEGFDSANRTFVRFINTGDTAITGIAGSLIDANGQVIGASNVTLFTELASKQAAWLNREDLSALAGAQWQGVASLALSSAFNDLKLLNVNFVNGETFFNFSCFENQDSGFVYLMTNSASVNNSETHVVNTSTESQQFVATVFNAEGATIGEPSTPLTNGMVEPGGRTVFNASDLELKTGAAPWSGPALVKLSGTGGFELMTRLTSPSGLISNTNCVRRDVVHNIEGANSTNRTFVRFINEGESAIGEITGNLFDKTGDPIGEPSILMASLAPKAAVFLSRDNFESIFGATWSDEASLSVSADNADSLRLINLNFVNNETFFNFSCYEASVNSGP